MALSDYWKGVIAAAGVVVSTAVAALNDGKITPEEGGLIATSALVAIGVVMKRNTIKGVKVSPEEREEVGP